MEGTVSRTDAAPARHHSNGATAVERRTSLLTKSERDKLKRRKEADQSYGRGKKVNLKTVRDKKLRGSMKRLEGKFETAALRARDAEILLEKTTGFLEPETELERTYKVRQQDIIEDVAVSTAQKRFELKLDQLGPYIAEYSRNGRDLLMAGRKGHIATMDWREGKLGCELQLGETIRDVKWLHNNQFFAVAAEELCLHLRQGRCRAALPEEAPRVHAHGVSALSLSPLHNGHQRWLKYQDTSTGQIVTELPTKLGPPTAITHNPYNAIIHAGHQNGTVTLWSPNSHDAVVKLLAHRGAVRSAAVDREARYNVTTGQGLPPDKDLDAKPENVEEEIRNRARGKNGALKKYLRKQRKKNIIDEKRRKADEIWNEQQKLRKKKTQEVEADLGPGLSGCVMKK
ncbi:WD repeat-containing protein [Verticillium alfalfae VaMs.102]|uniref:WD repeat-containing protein n=1 Tax=Verticillium alfalfae (strain VaMs.102 / ATCC MYA-4576 / FGSC 10136) TaxID=526221 RepID=C9SAP5_VERA1|nr:WD repeat-containing protein [Verticillium alfalfae VaMs.102]EEY15493.1 WD repeat-containing protein [Verticillium alfalfae VaMs.102]